MDEVPKSRRILLKISGEALKGDQEFGISNSVIEDISNEIKQAHDYGVEIAIVTGGGNFIRGNLQNKLNSIMKFRIN